jgi:hypothetical protein
VGGVDASADSGESETEWGCAIGGGLEYQRRRGGRIEYRYTDLSDTNQARDRLQGRKHVAYGPSQRELASSEI